MIVYSYLLYNVLLRQLEIFQWDGMILEVDDKPHVDLAHDAQPQAEFAQINMKHSKLGIYLNRRCNMDV